MVLPAAEKTASSPVDDRAPRRTCMLRPRASAICDATVRFQMSS